MYCRSPSALSIRPKQSPYSAAYSSESRRVWWISSVSRSIRDWRVPPLSWRWISRSRVTARSCWASRRSYNALTYSFSVRSSLDRQSSAGWAPSRATESKSGEDEEVDDDDVGAKMCSTMR